MKESQRFYGIVLLLKSTVKSDQKGKLEIELFPKLMGGTSSIELKLAIKSVINFLIGSRLNFKLLEDRSAISQLLFIDKIESGSKA